jgi:hypothetical protein
MYGGISTVTLSRSNPRAKQRWALLAPLVAATVLLLTSLVAAATPIPDENGANDEPG